MANPAWSGVSPALPETVAYGSFRRGFAQRYTEFASDRGPAPRRARFAASSRAESFELYLTDAQEAALRTFFETTLAGGTLAFEMFDPAGGADRLVRFAEPPASQFHAPGIWRAGISLEVLPA